MRKFEFRDSSAKLDIAGLQFSVELGDGLLIAKAKNIQDRAMGYEAKMKSLGASNDPDAVQKIVDEVCSFVYEAVDELLGEGAYESIFNGRSKNMYDHIDLLEFLVGSLTDEMEKFKAQYGSKYSPKRIDIPAEEETEKPAKGKK
ncbi:MAG: hypothetical protein Q4D77_01665 [Peptostreptococcaceae bacterium]|nr:hypothetical protein [Peptostreptococcaceae bacterium]